MAYEIPRLAQQPRRTRVVAMRKPYQVGSLALLCSGCLQPATCVELLSCPVETADAGDDQDAGEGSTDTADPNSDSGTTPNTTSNVAVGASDADVPTLTSTDALLDAATSAEVTDDAADTPTDGAVDAQSSGSAEVSLQGDASASDSGASSKRQWSSPVVLQNVNTEDYETSPSISADGLELYFMRSSGGGGNATLFVAKRSSLSTSFETAVAVNGSHTSGGINTTGSEEEPEISNSGLELYFVRNGKLMVASRSSVIAVWESAEEVPGIDSDAHSPTLAGDGLTLYFTQYGETDCGTSGYCVKRITRLAIGQPWSAVPSTPESFGGLSYASVAISHDNLELVLCERGSDALAAAVQSHRTSTAGAFSTFDTIVNFPADDEVAGCSFNHDASELFLTVRREDFNTDIAVSLPL